MGLFRLGDLYNNCGRKNKSTRDAWLEKVLGQIPDGSKILDAGAGELQYKKYCDHLEYVSQDFGQYDGKGDSIGLQKTQGWDNTKLDIVSDITNIPVSDASFDAVMCIEVLEHIPEPILAIKEFYRILRGGYDDFDCASLFFDAFCPILFLQRIQPIFLRANFAGKRI